MAEKAAVFEEIYRNYLARIREIDFAPKAELLGIAVENGVITITFLGEAYRIYSDRIEGPDGEQPIHSISVLLSQSRLRIPPSLMGTVTASAAGAAGGVVSGSLGPTPTAIQASRVDCHCWDVSPNRVFAADSVAKRASSMLAFEVKPMNPK